MSPRIAGQLMKHYALCSLHVASDFELPELTEWGTSIEAEPDVVFRRGAVPQELDAPDHVGVTYQTRGSDTYLFKLAGTGRYLIRQGREIVVEPDTGADPISIRAMLIGVMQAILWYQRCRLPLHGSAVLAGDRALIVAGPSGAGKSTIAAGLVARGAPLLADDVCVVDCDTFGTPHLLPGYPKLRLWRQSLRALGLSGDALARALPAREKFIYPPAASSDTPVEIGDIVIVRRLADAKGEIERLDRLSGMRGLLTVIHLPGPARALGFDRNIFQQLNSVLRNGTRIWRIDQPDDLSRLGTIVDTIIGVTG